jgi:hypothetical protein
MSNEIKSLKAQLLRAGLGLTESDFESHCSDLYVLNKPRVYDWLKSNYDFPQNITKFIGAQGSNWSGQQALNIPFTYTEYFRFRRIVCG